MKSLSFFSIFVMSILLLSTCSTSNIDSRDHILHDQIGMLSWKGSPAVDGAGMLFEVGDREYGAPGTPEDYSQFFRKNKYEVQIKADIKLTGKKTVRGWGATFPEIKFIRVERI